MANKNHHASQGQGCGRKEKTVHFSALNGIFPSCISKWPHIPLTSSVLVPCENSKLGLALSAGGGHPQHAHV